MVEIHKVKPLLFPYNALDGISEQQLKYHHDVHYAAYISGRNRIETQLEEMRKKGEFPEIRGVKLGESHNASGMILHEVYWETLGGKGGEPSGRLAAQIRKDFGSYDAWKKEFLDIATTGRGWVLLCFDPSDLRLHNYSVDFHDQGAVWGSIPILALDLWEHAYYTDQGPNRAKYLEAFFKNINWERIDEKFEGITSKLSK